MALAHPPHVGRTGDGGSYTFAGRSHPSFEVVSYVWPAGYRYSVLDAGQYLPPELWLPQYFIQDSTYYDLTPPPAGYEWVRYGPDMLLIDLDDGRIRQVVYGVFASPGWRPDQLAVRSYRPPGDVYGDPNFLSADPPLPGQY